MRRRLTYMEEKNSEKKERKMRDSGIPWIGEVPDEWEVMKIGHCFRLKNEKNFLPENKVQQPASRLKICPSKLQHRNLN